MRSVTRTPTTGAAHRGAALTAVALLLAACTSGTTPGDGPSGAADGRPAGPPPATSMTTPSTSEGLAAVAREAGLDAGTAWVAAHTASTVRVVDGHTFVVEHAFPNGASAEVTYRLSGGGDRRPADGVELDAVETADSYTLTTHYALDAASLPADLRAQVLDGIPPAAAGAEGSEVVLRQAALRADDSPDTVDVVATAVLEQARETYIDSWADRARSEVASGSWEVFKAGGKVWDAVGANEMVSAALASLDSLEQCAENPTNPITRGQYAKDPAARQKVTDQIKALRAEVKESTAALFLQLLVDTGSSLSSAKWLGFLVSPATAYIKQTLSDTITERLREAEALVPKCTALAYEISGTSPSAPSGIRYSGTACSLEKRFTVKTTGDLVGTLSFRPNRETGGTFAYTGKVGNAPFKVDGSGAYTVALSGDARSGTLRFDFQSTVRIPNVGPQSGGGPVSLRLTATEPCAP